MTFKAELLIFDLDGTLADTKDDIATSVNLTLKELGLPEEAPGVIYTYIGSGVRRLIQQAVGEAEGERFREAMRIFRGHYMTHLLDTTKLYPGIDGVLDHFRSKKMAVVTNKPQAYADPIAAGLKIRNRFDLILGGDNGLPLKPDPKMLLTVLEKLSADPKRTVMIGDGLHDIHASRAAGIAVCAVGYGLGDPDELRRAGPDFFCETVDDLMRVVV
ncbi:MAG TPA: HAD-IA family hydrolase [Nitrospiria bacterium]|nr:HAD-IA family hydrolase [Nitrospiria bacterium]